MNTPPEQESNEGINIVVCPIHGNKKYNIKPPHFCDHKIPGYANSHCACICTCVGTHKIEDWRKAFWKQFTQDGEILADEYATQTPKEIEEFIENEKKESYTQGWNEGQQAMSAHLVARIEEMRYNLRNKVSGYGATHVSIFEVDKEIDKLLGYTEENADQAIDIVKATNK